MNTRCPGCRGHDTELQWSEDGEPGIGVCLDPDCQHVWEFLTSG